MTSSRLHEHAWFPSLRSVDSQRGGFSIVLEGHWRSGMFKGLNLRYFFEGSLSIGIAAVGGVKEDKNWRTESDCMCIYPLLMTQGMTRKFSAMTGPGASRGAIAGERGSLGPVLAVQLQHTTTRCLSLYIRTTICIVTSDSLSLQAVSISLLHIINLCLISSLSTTGKIQHVSMTNNMCGIKRML